MRFLKCGEGLLLRAVLLAACSVTFSACTPSAASVEPQQVVTWHTLGSWSGHGNTQTESFIYETGALRVRWETANQPAGRTGTLRLALLSAVSGRQMVVPVDHRGMGKGESYFAESPHQAYVLIESSDVDWSFTIEEGTIGTQRTGS